MKWLFDPVNPFKLQLSEFVKPSRGNIKFHAWAVIVKECKLELVETNSSASAIINQETLITYKMVKKSKMILEIVKLLVD